MIVTSVTCDICTIRNNTILITCSGYLGAYRTSDHLKVADTSIETVENLGTEKENDWFNLRKAKSKLPINQ